jgi:hypothetical protein
MEVVALDDFRQAVVHTLQPLLREIFKCRSDVTTATAIMLRRAYTAPIRLLQSWPISRNGKVSTIELLHGDLAWLPSEQAVDILVVSASANDYVPTPQYLIGALYRKGISVVELAKREATDMREGFSCWISEPLGAAHSFRRILRIESGWRGSPPEITDDFFRALAPLSIEYHRRTVAMPVIGTGDAGRPADQMLELIVQAAVARLKKGRPLRLSKLLSNRPISWNR